MNTNRRRSIVRATLLLLVALVLGLGALSASAATIVTPTNLDGWGPTDVRADATVGITTAQPRSGDGSLQFQTITVTPGQDKADFTKTWNVPTRTLDQVSKVAFEYYRDSSSTTAAHFIPVLRLLFLHDNAPAGAGPEDHVGYLIWEGTYNGVGTPATNTWHTKDITNENFWMRYVSGPNFVSGCERTIQNFGVTLDDWLTGNPQGIAGDCVAPDLDATTLIVGINTGVGSGWGANFLGFVDNVELAFGADVVSANFEPTPQCTTVCYADAVNGNDANGGTSPADAKKTIQAAIDQVSAGGEVRVLPGAYSETATGRDVLGSGSYQFGLFFEDDAKDGVTLQGVTAADVAITDPTATEAVITTNATNNFGYSGVFVEADDVTIAGVEIGDNTPSNNKTIEVIGDGFTFKNSFLNVSDGGSLYFGDWRFDTGTDTSYIQSYTVDNNVFSDGSSVDLTSGAGYSGPVAGRQITNNDFTFSLAMYTASGNVSWPNVSFTGDTTDVPWFVYPMSGAVITGNTFTNNAPDGRHIRARGIADDSTFDWESYWNDNTFNKAVIVGPNLFNDVRSYSYMSGSYNMNDVRQIGAVIQQEVDHAAPGDTVLVNEGTYVEQVVVTKSITLEGEDGQAVTFIKAPATMPVASNSDSTIVKIAGAGVEVEMSGFTVTGPGPGGCGTILAGIFVRDGAYANIHDNTITDVRDTGLSGCQNGIGIFVGRQSLATTGTADITNNTIKAYQKAGIVVDNTGSHANIEGNQVLGDGPISYIAENGIQVSRGATAEINGNTISGHSYAPASVVSTGLYLWGAATINTDGNTISENQVGIYVIDANGTHKNNIVTATATGTGSPYFWGIIVDAPPPTHVPQPFDGDVDAAGAQSVGPNSAAADQVVLVTGNTITSDGSAGGVGLETDAGFGSFDIDLTATKNLIHNWEYGVYVYECTSGCTGTDFANVSINRNSIVGNTAYGMYASTIAPVTNATCNWWGDASGPSGEGPGTGDAAGVDIDFDPWLASDNLNLGCGSLYISPNYRAGVIDGVVYSDEDILMNVMGTSDWEMYFDGSDVGIKVNLTDFTFSDDNCILMTFNGNQNIPGVWLFKPQDIAKFCPTSLGETTAGTFELYFDGSDVGLNARAETIDSLDILPNGDLIITTKGSANIPRPPMANLKAKKSDLLVFSPTSLGTNTAGSWDVYLNSLLVGGLKKANPIGLDIQGDDVYMSLWNKFSIGNVTGDFNDIIIIHPDYSVEKFWDGNDYGYTGRVHGLHIVFD